ncbi:MAG TPA: hypothetical protein DCW29_21750 [Janthinobacterium sp.]|nr:hypothetical protein [Janthinobacterium sp.]
MLKLTLKPTPKLFCALGALLLSACVTTPAPAPAPLPRPCPPVAVLTPAPDSLINELLTYQAGLRQMPPAEVSRALLELSRQEASAKNTVRRAMLLAAVRGNGDLGRAQALLDGVLQAGGAEEQALKGLAQFLAAAYAEARRQDEVADKLNAQIREGQRRNDLLNEKLEALKNIERTLSARPAAPVK